MHIRSVEPGDFPRVAALTNHYIRTTAIHFATVPVTAGELQAAWEQSRVIYPFLICEEGPTGGFIGYAKASRWRERAAYARTTEVGIYLDPAFHGRGYGRALYERLIGDCVAAGFHTLVAGIALPNPASIRLHEAVGFRLAGTFREVGRKFEAWHDVAFYQRMLG